MKLLVLNPNTSATMTGAAVAEVARFAARFAAQFAAPGVEVVGATAAFGAEVIASRESFVVGAHAALDAWRRHGNGVDAAILACFGDPGLAALREIASVPVVGLAESSIREAAATGAPWAILTAGAAWDAMLRETVALSGAGAAFRGIVLLEATGLDIARDRDGFRGRVAAGIERAAALGARQVILGGAGFAGMTESLAAQSSACGVRLIDCLESATREALRAA